MPPSPHITKAGGSPSPERAADSNSQHGGQLNRPGYPETLVCLGRVGVRSGNISRRYPPELKEQAVRIRNGRGSTRWRLIGIGSGRRSANACTRLRLMVMAGSGPRQRIWGGTEGAETGSRGAETGQRDPHSSLKLLRGRARPATPYPTGFAGVSLPEASSRFP